MAVSPYGQNPYMTQVDSIIRQYVSGNITPYAPVYPATATTGSYPTTPTTPAVSTQVPQLSPEEIMQARIEAQNAIREIEAQEAELENTIVVSDAEGNQVAVSKDAYDVNTGYIAQDGKNDGKIGFWNSVKNIGKGIGKFFTSAFTDETGKFSLKKTLKTLAIGALCVGASVLLPGVGTALVVGGIALSGVGLGKNIVKACNATTDEEKEKAFQGIGTNAVGLAASLVGAKKMAISKNLMSSSAASKTTRVGKFFASAKDCLSAPGKLIKHEFISTNSGGARTLLANGTYGATVKDNFAKHILKNANGWSDVKSKTLGENLSNAWKGHKESIKSKLDYRNWGNGTKEAFNKTDKELTADIAKLDKQIKKLDVADPKRAELVSQRDNLRNLQVELKSLSHNGTKNLTQAEMESLKNRYCNNYNTAKAELTRLENQTASLKQNLINAEATGSADDIAAAKSALESNTTAIKAQRDIMHQNTNIYDRVSYVDKMNASQTNPQWREFAENRNQRRNLLSEQRQLRSLTSRTSVQNDRLIEISQQLTRLETRNRAILSELNMTGAKGSEIITAMNNSKGRAMSDFVSNVRLHNGFNKALMLNYTLPFTSPMAGQTILLTNKLSPDAPTQNLGLQYDEAASSAQIDAARQEFSAAKAQYQSMLDQLNGVTSTGSSAPMGTNGQRTAQDIMMNWNFTYGV